MSIRAGDQGQLPLALIPLAGLLILAFAAGAVVGGGRSDAVTGSTQAALPTTSELPSVTPSLQPVLVVVEEYDPPVEVSFAAGEHIGYRFDEDGAVIDETTLTLSQPSAALADAEVMDREGVRYFRMASGAFDGYLVPISDAVSPVGG